MHLATKAEPLRNVRLLPQRQRFLHLALDELLQLASLLPQTLLLLSFAFVRTRLLLLHRHYVGFLLLKGCLLALAFLADLIVQELADL